MQASRGNQVSFDVDGRTPPSLRLQQRDEDTFILFNYYAHESVEIYIYKLIVMGVYARFALLYLSDSVSLSAHYSLSGLRNTDEIQKHSSSLMPYFTVG